MGDAGQIRLCTQQADDALFVGSRSLDIDGVVTKIEGELGACAERKQFARGIDASAREREAC